MGGFDDHGAIIGDWALPSPSPRSFFSSMLGEDIGLRSISQPKGETKSEFVFPAPEGQNWPENAYTSDRGLAASVDQETDKSGPFSEQKRGPRGGLLERMAARAGFNAPRLNTDNIRPAGISQNHDVRSPYLTIPPGLISPTTLLDSPVFLSNSLVQPSPTTGKFQFAPNGNGKSSMMFSESLDRSKENFFENINSSLFTFNTAADSVPNSRDAVNKVTPSFPARQPFPSIEVSVQSDNSFPTGSVEPSKLHSQNGPLHQLQSEFSRAAPEKNAEGNIALSKDMPFGGVIRSAENSPPLDEQQAEDVDQRFSSDANANNAPSDDGYNWRKYGQKQVKGSDYPRSYYKCTHPNCPVKKKVERSHEGHITEIIYKGAHNHPKPPPNRRAGTGSSNALSDIAEQGETVVNGDQVWMQKRTTDWRQDNLEVAPQNGSQFESVDAVDVSSTFSNEEEEEDRATRGSVSLGYDEEGDESESKRRKVEAYAADVSGNTRAIREPRVVVQTTSEVDILDDGYRWRKYGQKVVKGNPNPRSYYKCTNAGCTVRKHVERASHDLKSVITTYEGKHNHDVPAARNSSHMNSAVPNTMPLQSQAGQSQVNRTDSSQLQNSMARFERPQSLGGSYGLGGRQQFGSSPFGFGYQNQSGLANLAMAGLGGNPNHQLLGQPRQMNEMGYMYPKGEPKVEPMSDTGLNQASSSAVYQQMMMNRLPLGPQM